MGLNWTEIAAEAAAETDRELAGEISSLTTMTDEEIEELFPAPHDKQRLAQLMEIVKSAEERNVKVSRIVANVEDLADVVLTLAGRVV